MMLCTHFHEVFQVGKEDSDHFYEGGIYDTMAGGEQKGQQKDRTVQHMLCTILEIWHFAHSKKSFMWGEKRGVQNYFVYRVSREEMSIFWEVIVSVILSKKVYMYVSYSERFLR
jgi:hypothetical protein